jgi:predicted phage terminase large subunit-like protein
MEIIDQLFDVWKVWRPRLIGIEEGAIASSIGPFLNKRIQEEQIWEMAIEPLKIRRMDKEARARSIQGRMSQGKVFFPKNAEWTPTLVNELLRFGQTAHDDCVDALAWIGQMLETIVAPEAPTRQKTESWRDKLHKFAGEQESGSWMAA